MSERKWTPQPGEKVWVRWHGKRRPAVVAMVLDDGLIVVDRSDAFLSSPAVHPTDLTPRMS